MGLDITNPGPTSVDAWPMLTRSADWILPPLGPSTGVIMMEESAEIRRLNRP